MQTHRPKLVPIIWSSHICVVDGDGRIKLLACLRHKILQAVLIVQQGHSKIFESRAVLFFYVRLVIWYYKFLSVLSGYRKLDVTWMPFNSKLLTCNSF